MKIISRSKTKKARSKAKLHPPIPAQPTLFNDPNEYESWNEDPKPDPSDKIGKSKTMNFNSFARKPFTVQAVEITADNLDEVAKYVGDVREEEDGTRYILVDRRLVPNVLKVYPGFYMTKMGKNVRCYTRKIFREQFTEATPEIKQWIDHMDGLGDNNGGGQATQIEQPQDTEVKVGAYGRIIES